MIFNPTRYVVGGEKESIAVKFVSNITEASLAGIKIGGTSYIASQTFDVPYGEIIHIFLKNNNRTKVTPTITANSADLGLNYVTNSDLWELDYPIIVTTDCEIAITQAVANYYPYYQAAITT